MENQKAKKQLEVILRNNISEQLESLKDLRVILQPLEQPITFNLKTLNEILLTDTYFGKGPI